MGRTMPLTNCRNASSSLPQGSGRVGDQFNKSSPICRHRILTNAKAATEADEVEMQRHDVFPSKYLTAADLKGKSHIVIIERAPYETLKGLDGKETRKIVLYLRGAEKSLPLNVTNFDAVCVATGCPDTDDWPGKRIELYPTTTTMGGKVVDCIRIRRPSASRPVVPPVPPAPDDEGSDEIPF
jgi:hypothetical protein